MLNWLEDVLSLDGKKNCPKEDKGEGLISKIKLLIWRITGARTQKI